MGGYLFRSDAEEAPSVERNKLDDGDELSKSGGENDDGHDVRETFGDGGEQSGAHEHDVDHSNSGSERQTHEGPANAHNDQSGNGESSDVESALNNPFGLNTVMSKFVSLARR